MRFFGLLFICSFGFCVTECFAKEAIPAHILEVGDLVFRQGIGNESKIIQILSSHPYSHIAMVAQIEPVMLIHATTNDDERQPNQVILSSLEDFVKHGKSLQLRDSISPKKIKSKLFILLSKTLRKTLP